MKPCKICEDIANENCKECRARASKLAYYYRNKAEIGAKQKIYREGNRKLCQERSKASALKNVEKYADTRRANYRKKRGIPIDDPFRKRKDGEGTIDSSGYKTITVRGHPNAMDDKGRIREHVYIMSQHINRALHKGETVHHKNGDRLDNRIENLELWDRSQPAGQRIEDKIDWCIEFLKRYGYMVNLE